MNPGELAAFPSGTGICHTFINNSEEDVLLFVGGERSKSNNRLFYPLHPSRKNDMPWSNWWNDIPLKKQGSHDGKPDKLRDLEKD